jgi:hypothetical protein
VEASGVRGWRGWLEAKDVLNTLPAVELKRRCARRVLSRAAS